MGEVACSVAASGQVSHSAQPLHLHVRCSAVDCPTGVTLWVESSCQLKQVRQDPRCVL